MATHKSPLCERPLAHPVIGPLVKLSIVAAAAQTSVKVFAVLAQKQEHWHFTWR